MTHPSRSGAASLTAFAATLSLFALVSAGCTPQQSADAGASPAADATPAATTADASPAAADGASPAADAPIGPPPPGPGAQAGGGFDTKPFKASGKPVTTKTGLQYEEMTVGKGKTATESDTVLVHYTGTLKNGKVFDSSRERGEPTSFSLQQVVPGFTEGIAGMKEGGRRRITMPPALGYGDNPPTPEIPPGSTLIFDVELFQVQ